MSNLYSLILVIHVLSAILGLGPVAAVAMLAAMARRNGALEPVSTPISTLLKFSGFSLALLLVTGILLDLVADGAFRGTWWYRLSLLLMIAIGALHGISRGAARKGLLARVEMLSYGMCALIAVMTILMEVKPF
jgi:hypothetical protein